jgi:hypothetical protein
MYWWRVRRTDRRRRLRIALSLLGLVVSGGILAVTTVEKFAEGGSMTVLITGIVIGLCFLNRGLAPKSYTVFGIDPIAELTDRVSYKAPAAAPVCRVAQRTLTSGHSQIRTRTSRFIRLPIARLNR